MKKASLFLFLAALCLILCSCRAGDALSLTGGYRYESPADCRVGGGRVEAPVDSISVNWIDGGVRIAWHDGADILLSETADHALTQPEELRWWVADGTLQVKYAVSGFQGGRRLNKQLTVLLPRGMTLQGAAVSTVSAEVETEALQAGKLAFETVSGSMALGIASADTVEVSNVSGTVTLDAHQLRRLEADTTSGALRLSIRGLPESITADSVSGDVTICLQEDVGFTARLSSVSGRIGGTLPMTQQPDRSYTAGDGSCSIRVSTVSGGLKLNRLP